MYRSKLVIWGVVLLATAGLAAAAMYTWVGGGANPKWDTCGNWQFRPGLFTKCYPSTDDDATIPTGTVELIDICIDDLYIEGDTTFQGLQSGGSCEPKTLLADVLRIEGGDHGTTVGLEQCAKIASTLQTAVCGT